MVNFKGNYEIRRVGSAIVAGSSIDNNSTRVDMSGYEGVVFFTTITDSVAAGLAKLTVEGNSADSDTGMGALAGAVAQMLSAVNDDVNDKVLVVEVCKPLQRFVQAVRTSSGANIAYGELYAVLYGPKTQPRPDHSTIGASALAISPAKS